MTSREIRTSFLEFFESKGHTIVPSASLIPAEDPTLLFTNAGMNQFKDVFLGTGTRSYSRATDSQKCIRVSGKHNDLEEVGHDTSHHTFFEMLGNWSFGDYYKSEAISYAYELLTEVWNLPKEKLWVTVYLEDDEAMELWPKNTDIPAERVLRFGDKDNFWEMGETGPCGPCSEIHIDLGPERCIARDDPEHKCGVNSDCPRFLELWNLVFIQYNRDEQGELHPLPQKHIDTGLGFERITAVLQGKNSDYDTDLFVPIINRVEEISSVKYNEKDGISHRVISDHIRCLTFSISDGVMPSNEGRGYVIRRILRRAVLYGKKIGLNESFLHLLVEPVLEIMGDAYPEILQRQDFVKKIILGEEERFLRTLDRGLEILDTSLAEIKSKGKSTLPGKKAFELSDTYGFPLDLTQIIAGEKGCDVDEQGFQDALQKQRERSRLAYQETGVIQKEVYADVYKEYGTTDFLGYEQTKSDSKIIALISGDELVSEASKGESIEIILDKTPFYGESGGQIGDIGQIYSDKCKVEVIDTIKPIADVIIHKCRIVEGSVEPGEQVTAEVDTKRRKDIAISHTATHILHDVLREVLGDHVRQSGSLVEAGRFRFDFTHFEALSKDELREVELRINRKVRENMPLSVEEMEIQKAKDKGALAFFGEKYGDQVRVVQIGDYSIELCGGTHLNSTGEIGLVKIISESSIAAGVRRIEALTGEAAYLRQRENDELLAEISSMLKKERTEIPARIQDMLDEQKVLEREIKRLKDKIALSGTDELIKNAQTVDGVKLVSEVLDNIDRDGLRALVDDLKNRIGSGVFVLASKTDGDVAFVTGVTPDLVKNKGLKAGDIVREVATIGGGRGGGRPEFAQGGSRNPSQIKEAIDKAPEIVKKMLKD